VTGYSIQSLVRQARPGRVVAAQGAIDDVDRNFGYMPGESACRCKGSTEIGEYLACLNRPITAAGELTSHVFGLVPETKYWFGTRRDNDL